MTGRAPRELQIAAIALADLFLAAAIAGPSPIALAAGQPQGATAPNAAFYRDVLPILQSHCQSCHRSGGISALPLETFEQAQRKAAAIADAVDFNCDG